RAASENSRRSRLQNRLGRGARRNGSTVVISFIAMCFLALLRPTIRPLQRFERGAQRIELLAESCPIARLEALERAVVLAERRMGAVALDRHRRGTRGRLHNGRRRLLAK